jgi:hypothetical protein
MGSHHIDNDISSELREIVRADNRIEWALLTLPYLVGPGLVFEQVSNPFFIFQSPFHMRDKPSEREAMLLCALHYSLKQFKSSV